MPWPDRRDGTAGRPPQRPANIPADTTSTSGSQSLPDPGDRQYRARWRLADEHRRLGIARLAHERMSLVEYYRHPRGGFYCRVVEGWRAA